MLIYDRQLQPQIAPAATAAPPAPAEETAPVIVADIQDELGRSVCKDLGPTTSSFIHCDVTKEPDIKNAVDIAVSKYGKLDIMFNNTGIVDDPKSRIIDNEKADFERVLSISQLASHAYTASKHAVVGLTKNGAAELGQFGIRVNCVSPYALVTPLAAKNFVKTQGEDLEKAFSVPANLKGVHLKAEDVAQAVLYLGSDDSKYVSGHNLLIDGGFSVSNHSFRMFDYSFA
ncbi:Short-chain dehydrogenase/reductase SDR [Cinnamomum micranthum f. kanehirae]|uniref:Short-chain dehydrogenase/reductase SDR n=1 Tax=Cinnamomum micranthum f. kanehirae TaxID=337451 RepID=A0A3S3NSQ9_9MAGN|nr:Short-chain dehydrogenase/reductase SDR [Cinnamomum micranthum f. kanehirae]